MALARQPLKGPLRPLMPDSLSDEQVRLLRLDAQRLVQPEAERSAASVARTLVGIQAQDQGAAALAVRARTTGLIAADIASERNHERSIVRTWAMRGTLHWIATEDVRWLLALLGPSSIAKNRRRREQLGLDDDTCARGVRALRESLARRGPSTRDEIVDDLAARGIRLEGQARPHLLYVAALDGVICCGPDRGSKETYVLLDDWVPRGPTLSRETALAELARRYLAAYGPASLPDFATWSGLAIGEARDTWQLIADEIVELDTSVGVQWILRARAKGARERRAGPPTVRLLGWFDNYLLGYRNRELMASSGYGKRINPGGGLVHPTVVVDGRVVGTWRSKRQRSRLELAVEPFELLSSEVARGVEAEAADVGRFLGLQSGLEIALVG